MWWQVLIVFLLLFISWLFGYFVGRANARGWYTTYYAIGVQQGRRIQRRRDRRG